MAGYWLSFRLDAVAVGGRTYDERWDALYAAIHDLAGVDYWQETSSFIVFETDKTIDQIMTATKRAVAPSNDLVLVRALDSKNARIVGPNTDVDIFRLMPYLTKS